MILNNILREIMKVIIIFTIFWALWAWSKEAHKYEEYEYKIIIERGYYKYLETYIT